LLLVACQSGGQGVAAGPWCAYSCLSGQH